MKLKKGDWFSIDVDRLLEYQLKYLSFPRDLEWAKGNAESLRGQKLQVHRIEHRHVIIYKTQTGGFTGVDIMFCIYTKLGSQV